MQSLLLSRAVLRPVSFLLAIALVVTAASMVAIGVQAEDPANEHFQRTWDRTDEPVANDTVDRTWIWGPVANTGPIQEDYAESPNGQRTVQYFDKSRMELTYPNLDPSNPFYVTNGLLVVELMTGRMQIGDAEFEPRDPAEVNVAGDQGDPNSPTYSDLAPLRSAPAAADGAVLTKRVHGNGSVSDDPSLASLNVTAAFHLTVPGIDHQIASPFWTFLNSSGPIIVNGQPTSERLFDPWFYATGYPVTEPYWADVLVAGKSRLVLMQCFERRCLTYTPGNPPGFETEAGNVGQHYYTWRYEQGSGGSPTATTTMPATATATATRTVSPTVTATATEDTTVEYELERGWGEPYQSVPRLYTVGHVEVNYRDHVWVTDAGNDRLVEFDENGIYRSSIGIRGSGAREFNLPVDLAYDADDRIFVADSGNSRIQVLNRDGEYLYEFGAPGTGNGQFTSLTAVAVYGDALYALEGTRARIQVFDLNGVYRFQFGSDGNGAGQFSGASDLAIDALGNVIVADTANSRIQRFNSSGGYLGQIGSFGTDDGQFSRPWGIGIAGDGSIYVTDYELNRVQKFSSAGVYISEWGSLGFDNGEFSTPVGIDVDSEGNIHVADSANARIQKFASDHTFLFFYSDGSRGKFNIPTDITTDLSGNLLVTDPQMDRPVVARYTVFGEPLDHYRHLEHASSQYDQPYASAVGDGGTWVVDRYANRVQRFSPIWSLLDSWGTGGTGPGQFSSPQDIAIDANGNIYVVDSGNNRVQKFDPNGIFLDVWGSAGNGDGQFNLPLGIAIDGERVYVTDSGNHRVQVFNRSGDYLDQWGQQGSGEDDLSGPFGIAIDGDGDGNILVVDNGNHRVQVFSPSGDVIGTFGSYGSDPGQFDGPLAIAVDAEGYAYVTEVGNHRIQKFERQP